MDYKIIFLLFFVLIVIILYKKFYRTYYIYHSDIDKEFKRQVRDILKVSSWNKSFKLKEVDNEQADIFIRLADRKFMDRFHEEKEYYPGTNKEIRFSITTQSRRNKPRIYIDSINWLNGVKESGLTLDEYRRYVINHEFGHGLGFDHLECNNKTSKDGICPVLTQATRGCPNNFKCGTDANHADQAAPKIPL